MCHGSIESFWVAFVLFVGTFSFYLAFAFATTPRGGWDTLGRGTPCADQLGEGQRAFIAQPPPSLHPTPFALASQAWWPAASLSSCSLVPSPPPSPPPAASKAGGSSPAHPPAPGKVSQRPEGCKPPFLYVAAA